MFKKYRKIGVFALPVADGGKHPVIKWKLYQNTNPTKAEQKRWFKEEGYSSMCFITGPLSGIVVVDADNETALEWCEENLPDTITQKTKRGKHYFFQYIDGVKNKTAANNIRGLDIRGKNGICMLDPTPGYKLQGQLNRKKLPPFPLHLFQAKNVKSTNGEGRYYEVGKHTRKSILKALDDISPDCDRTTWLEVCSALKTTFPDDGRKIAEAWSSKSKSKYTPESFEELWDSLKIGHHRYTTILHHAQKNDQDINGFISKFQVTTKYTDEIKNGKFVYPGILLERHISTFIGQSGSGKTAIFYNYIVPAIVKRGYKFIYCDLDSPASEHKRMLKFSKKHNFDFINPDTVRGESVETLLEYLRNLASGGDNSLTKVVFCFDTLKKFSHLMSKGGTKDFFKLMKRLTSRGATVILLGHANKHLSNEGKLVFEGVGDVRSDSDDLTYLYTYTDEVNKIQYVTFYCDKARGIYEKVTFTICKKSRKVDLHDSVVETMAMSEKPLHKEILLKAVEVLKKGEIRQRDMIANLGDIANQKTITKVLKYYAEDFPKPQILIKHKNGGVYYSLPKSAIFT